MLLKKCQPIGVNVWRGPDEGPKEPKMFKVIVFMCGQFIAEIDCEDFGKAVAEAEAWESLEDDGGRYIVEIEKM